MGGSWHTRSRGAKGTVWVRGQVCNTPEEEGQAALRERRTARRRGKAKGKLEVQAGAWRPGKDSGPPPRPRQGSWSYSEAPAGMLVLL